MPLEEIIHIATAVEETKRSRSHITTSSSLLQKNMSIASSSGSAAALTETRASGFCASCLAAYLEHDSSAAQVEVTKRGNILIIWMYRPIVLATMRKMKLSDDGMRLASLMLVFLFSKATGQSCQSYFRLLITVAAFLCQSLQLPRGRRYSKASIFMFVSSVC